MKPIEITSDNFQNTVKDGIVVLDFWASWCMPCRAFAPIFEKAAEKHADLKFGKVNTEEQGELSAAFQIRSIPTVMAFKDGIQVFEQPGMLPAALLEKLIEQLRALDMDQVRKEIAAEQRTQQQANG